MQIIRPIACFLILIAVTPVASAYIGPGSGISVVGSLLGLLATILLAFGAIILWPYRRLLKKRALKKAAENDNEQTADKLAGETLNSAEAEDGQAS